MYYLTSSGGCWDCSTPGGRWTRGRRRLVARSDDDQPRPRAAKLPLVSAVVLAELTANQRDLYAAVRRGDTPAAIRRARGTTRQAVDQAVRRLARQLAAHAPR